MRIALFWHVFAVQHWYDICDEIFFAIHRARLRCPIIIGMIGQESAEVELYSLAGAFDIPVRIIRSDVNTYECHTLRLLHDAAQNADYDALGYIHNKGTTSASPTYTKWRWCMEMIVIHRWRWCIDALERADIAGCFYREDWPCFGGNWWWATTEWIRKLPRPLPGQDRFAYEKWVARGPCNPKVVSFIAQNTEIYLPCHHTLLGQPYTRFVQDVIQRSGE